MREISRNSRTSPQIKRPDYPTRGDQHGCGGKPIAGRAAGQPRSEVLDKLIAHVRGLSNRTWAETRKGASLLPHTERREHLVQYIFRSHDPNNTLQG
jgi:hypothetical protein